MLDNEEALAVASQGNASLYTGSHRTIKRCIMRVLEAGLVPFITSSPGLGKSAMVAAIAEQGELYLIDLRITSMGPEDFSGLPDLSGDKSVYKPFDVFPLEGDELPINPKTNKPYKGFLLFLDEFNSGSEAVLVASYKLLLNRMIGNKKLHKDAHIVAAGNRDIDRAITNEMGSALDSRVIWLELELDGTIKEQFSDFMEDVAIPQKWDERFISFLYYKPEYLNSFKPERTEKTFSCPRTLDSAQRLAQGYDITNEDALLYTGALGRTVGTEFVNFVELFTQIPKLDAIMNDPMRYPIPRDPGVQWATISMLRNNVDKKNLPDIAMYVENFPAEFRILFWRLVQTRNKNLKQEPDYKRNVAALGRYLYAED